MKHVGRVGGIRECSSVTYKTLFSRATTPCMETKCAFRPTPTFFPRGEMSKAHKINLHINHYTTYFGSQLPLSFLKNLAWTKIALAFGKRRSEWLWRGGSSEATDISSSRHILFFPVGSRQGQLNDNCVGIWDFSATPSILLLSFLSKSISVNSYVSMYIDISVHSEA